MIETAIGYTALSWVLIQYVDLICTKFIGTKHESKAAMVMGFVCLKCWAFWITLFIDHNIFVASLAGLFALMLEEHLVKKKI